MYEYFLLDLKKNEFWKWLNLFILVDFLFLLSKTEKNIKRNLLLM